MLGNLRVGPTLPAADLERAKRFYTEKLGLVASQEWPEGVQFECGGGTGIFVFQSPNAGKCPTTYAGWEVDDIEKTAQQLKDRGVAFEEYDTPDYKTIDGIATMGEAKAAWFKDSEGNILALSKMA